MAFSGSGARRAGDQQFFSPMGAGVGAVFSTPGAPAGPPPRPAIGGLPGAPAGTPPKLAVHDMYRRWFQMADAGACKRKHLRSLLGTCVRCWAAAQTRGAPGVALSLWWVRPQPGTTLCQRLSPTRLQSRRGCCADNDGRLTGQDAVRFFERSELPRDILAHVWDNSDSRRQGFLDFAAFVRALELVSLAQVLAL